jgi:hypothetical protein
MLFSWHEGQVLYLEFANIPKYQTVDAKERSRRGYAAGLPMLR